MSSLRDYQGHSAAYEIDEERGPLAGRVEGLSDVITFEGRSVEELVRAFHESVDEYLAFCEQRNRPPEKPYSGRFVVRIRPELHRAAGVRLNAWVAERIEEAVQPRPVAVRVKQPRAGSSRR